MADAHYSMKAVSQITGLTPHVIRIWEKRYSAVEPNRTNSNQRRYSEDDVERLTLLSRSTRAGHNIGAIARLNTEQLRKLVSDLTEPGPAAPPTPSPGNLTAECLRAVKALDADLLERTLSEGAVQLGSQGVLQKVIAPLTYEIGELWREGTITAAHEHFATAVIRIFLGHAAQPFGGNNDSPGIVVGTPSGQLHELGALLAGASAANLGWKVTYIGASLPSAEIASVTRQSQARAVALSLVYPEDDPRLAIELMRLRELLGPEIPFVVGGRAAPSYQRTLENIGATVVKDLNEFTAALDKIRSTSLA